MRTSLLSFCAIFVASLSPWGCSGANVDLVGLRCGNGIVEEGELCDGSTSKEYCSEDCLSQGGYCGDGIVETRFGEECDTIQSSSGEGGAGGASDGEKNRGCSACEAARGFLCDSGTNKCSQTGVDPEEKAADHIPEICTWFLGLSGGEEVSFTCAVDDEAFTFTTATQDGCEEVYEVDDECTIDELESWARNKDRCELQLERAPCEL